MKPILTRLFAGMFLLLAAQAFGQAPTMTTNFVVTSPASPSPYPIGTHIVIELRVTNFTNIESMQFPITYNKDAMKFDSIGDPAFSNWNLGNFVSVPASGKIGISWDGYSNGASMPFSFPNGTAIFKLYFTVIGNGTSSVNINGAAAPPAIDIAGNGGTTGTIVYQGGGTPTITLGTGNPPPPPLVGFKIVANTIYIPKGERGCMPITVNDFDNIQSMQWAIHWDNAVLNYECTRSYNLTGWSGTDFATTMTPGTLLATWADPAGVGVTRADGVRIVDICFKAVGAPGGSTTITIDGNGFAPGSGGAEAINITPADVWTTGGPNGASGVSAPINIITNPASPFDVTYEIEKKDVAPNAVGCVAVKVKNFTAVTNAEFAISYNPAELQYQNTDLGANPLNLQTSNYSVPALPNPLLPLHYFKFLWANVNGATVADNSTIFSVCFKNIAPIGTTSNLNIASTQCPTVTGIGTAKSGGGVSMASSNGWIKSASSIVLTPTHIACTGINSGAITLDYGTNPTPTGYAWSNGAITQNINGLGAGTYTVTVTSPGGATIVATATVNQPLQPLSQTNTVNTVSCFGGSNGAINLTPAGGTPPYTYCWTSSSGAPCGVSTQQDPSNLTSDIYTVKLTDMNGCTTTANVTVSSFSAISLPAANISVTNVTCAGLSTGGIMITPVGGSGGYTYDWSHDGAENPDNDPKDLTGMQAGIYTVTITDSNGCVQTLPTGGAGITIAPAPPFSAAKDSQADVKCFGSATGSANITVTGGTGNKTFCWSATGAAPCASDVEDPTNLPAGTYVVKVTDVNGCTTSISNIVIADAPGVLTVDGTTTPSPCFEQASGSITSNSSGGWGGYGYAWTGPIPNIPPVANLQNLPGGAYTVTVTDSKQCTTTKTFTVGGSPAIVAGTDVDNVTCFGTNNGAIDLNLSGGNPPYNVVWTNTPLTGESIGVLAPGSYQPTVTDAQQCTKVFAPIVVTGPQELLVDETITEANPANGSVNIEITQGGTPGFNYLWSNGATTQDISNLSEGSYTVTITDANSCSRTFTYLVPNGNVVSATLVQSIKNACSGDGCINLTIPQTAAGFFPVTLNWGFGSKQLINSAEAASICNLNAGLYNITVTAANGNSTVLVAVQVGQLDPASVNSNTTNPYSSLTNNGKITLDKTSGVVCNLTYLWSTGATTAEISNLAQGSYTVTITNPCSGCVSEETFTLVYSGLIGVSDAKNPNCAATSDGYIHINLQGGHLPYDYTWEGPNGFQSTLEDIDNLAPGEYYLVATDQDNRVYNDTFSLTSQSNLNITNVNELSNHNGVQVSGASECDGVAEIAFIPGVGTNTIVWSNGVTGPNNSSLCGGAYSVTVTDAAGCTSVWSDELTAPDAITSNPEAVAVKCAEDCNGSAKISVAGGIQPYNVRWSTGQTDPVVFSNGFSQAVNLCGGDYTVTITDKNNIQFVSTVTVPQPPAIVASFEETTPRNFNACDGELLIDAAGAVAPVTYTWSGSFGHTGDGERADNLCSGEFVEFYITDANGCTAYATDSVPYPEDGCFRVSPVITPGQQDGKNDFVVITCIETADDSHMEIYNRWGQLVFESDDYTNDDTDPEHNWNGLTNSGAALAEGVYYYVLTFTFTDDQGQKREDTRKGAINLLR